MKYEQLAKLICDETNVGKLTRKIATTDKGDLIVVYDNHANKTYFTIGGVPVGVSRETTKTITDQLL